MIGNFAVIENDTVINVIVVGDASSFSQASGKELMSINEYPLSIGNYRRGGAWYSMINEIETIVPKTEIELLEEKTDGLAAQLAQTNTDMMDFMDYVFTIHPE